MVVGFPVADHIVQNSPDDYMTYSALFSGAATLGYNIIDISPPAFFTRGAILYIRASSGAVGLNTASTAGYRDYGWDDHQLLAPNTNLFVKVITQSTSNGLGSRINAFTHTYSSLGSFSLHAYFYCNDAFYEDVTVIAGEPSLLKFTFRSFMSI